MFPNPPDIFFSPHGCISAAAKRKIVKGKYFYCQLFYCNKRTAAAISALAASMKSASTIFVVTSSTP